MEDIKNKVEAVLFTLGKFVKLEELSNLTGIASQGLLKEAIQELIQDYKSRSNSLELIEENNKFKLNIKKEYLYLTTNLLKDTELDKPTQETLALIAYKQPVMQSIIIKMRGNTAYDHVKKLKENEFVSSEKAGRTRLLKTTRKFYDYFDVVEDKIKEKFSNVNP